MVAVLLAVLLFPTPRDAAKPGRFDPGYQFDMAHGWCWERVVLLYVRADGVHVLGLAGDRDRWPYWFLGAEEYAAVTKSSAPK